MADLYNTCVRIVSMFILKKKIRKEFRKKHLRPKDSPTKHQLKVFNSILSGNFTSVPDDQVTCFLKGSVVCAGDPEGSCPHLKGAFVHKEALVGWQPKMPKCDFALLWGSGAWPPQLQMALWAKQNHIPLIRLEDGFLRSADTIQHAGINPKYTQGISFTISNDVPYFDATRSSLLERMLNNPLIKITPAQIKQARACIDFITQNNLTKYNHQPIFTPYIGRPNVPKVLVADQSYGDFSILKGKADPTTFHRILQAAITENPDADIIIKTHPDTLAPGSFHPAGYYSNLKAEGRIYLMTEPINPICLLKSCDKVYVCTTQLGFEALLCQKEVHVFGMPFYAGWGLTKDALTCPRRTMKRSLEEVFYMTYILHSLYINPNTGKICEINEAMDYLLQLRKTYFKEFHIREEQ